LNSSANEANVKALMHSERLCDEIRQQLQLLRAEHVHQQQQFQRDKDNSNRENDVQQREIQELKRRLESTTSCSSCESLSAELSALKQSALVH
jgi:predicted transposase YbfD/YdcC